MEMKDTRDDCVKAAQEDKLRAARKLLEITEKGLGAENAENDELLDNLSARQDAINELLEADKTLSELAEKREAACCGQPENLAIVAETDEVLQKIQELYREDTEEAQARMSRYRDKLIQLRDRTKKLSTFPKNSDGTEGSHFETRG